MQEQNKGLLDLEEDTSQRLLIQILIAYTFTLYEVRCFVLDPSCEKKA